MNWHVPVKAVTQEAQSAIEADKDQNPTVTTKLRLLVKAGERAISDIRFFWERTELYSVDEYPEHIWVAVLLRGQDSIGKCLQMDPPTRAC